MELNRKSSAGSVKSPLSTALRKKKKINKQSNSAMSKYPSPRKSNVSSINSGDDDYGSPGGSTPRSRVLVQSKLSEYDFSSQKKSVHMVSRQTSTIA